jgi:hypothetical protein
MARATRKTGRKTARATRKTGRKTARAVRKRTSKPSLLGSLLGQE